MIPYYVPATTTWREPWDVTYVYNELEHQLVGVRAGNRPGKPGWDRGHEIDVASRLCFRGWIIAGCPLPG